MACDTFIKIAQKCRRQFVQIQVGEVMPFIEELLSNINSIICDLQPQQVGFNSHFAILYTEHLSHIMKFADFSYCFALHFLRIAKIKQSCSMRALARALHRHEHVRVNCR